ncbi:MAG: hypothetical protein QOD72_800, partial [Acidimicrobiaceae bacterium]|nr:hypothetical protein [Acidimicrobiaceae bacterium]
MLILAAAANDKVYDRGLAATLGDSGQPNLAFAGSGTTGRGSVVDAMRLRRP